MPHGGKGTGDNLPSFGHALAPHLHQGPCWPSAATGVTRVLAPARVAETHLEAVLGGDEEHFEGLPALEGEAAPALLAAPGAALLGVEDHHRLVQPRVEMQSGLAPLLAAQQVHIKPGGWGSGQVRSLEAPD